MMSSSFAGKEIAYAAGRSEYPPALYDHLVTQEGFSASSAVADMGSGTGKFARPLLERGLTVYAVEPDAGMLGAAQRALGGYPRFYAVRASAEHSGLAAASVDQITCASAFHWFDPLAFRAECLRILRPGGKVVLVWNVRDGQDDFSIAYRAVLAKFCPNFTSLSHGHDACQEDVHRFFGCRFERLSFEDDALQTRERFLARTLSSSYAPSPGSPRCDALSAALGDLFDAWQKDDAVRIPAHTVAYIGQPAPLS